MAVAEQLVYRPTLASAPIQAEIGYSFAASGPPMLTSELLASNAGLAIQQFRTTNQGRRTISAIDDGGSRIEIVFEHARVEGRTQDGPFQLEFDGGTGPGADPIRRFAWGVGVGPRRYTLGPNGEYRLDDGGQDPHAEAAGVILDAPVRLTDRTVTVGDEWTSDWTGVSRRKHDGAMFHYRQTARVEEIVAGATPRARISFSTSGSLHDPSGKELQAEKARLEGKGSILLDVQTGTVVGVDSTGTISTEIKTAGLKVVFGYTSKYELSSPH
jgi:hypothetical protein